MSRRRGQGMRGTAGRWVLVGLGLLSQATVAWAGGDSTRVPLRLDRESAAWLVSLPLACVDKLHDAPKGKGYVWESTLAVRPDFAKSRAFYGCSDWHSAVNSTWTMVQVLKSYPDMPLARLIREKLNDHLSQGAIKGEVAFFTEDGDKSFERPYGYAWLLRLYGALKSWDDPDAKKWAANIEPLAKVLQERLTPYLKTLAAPMRVGTHANTAFTLQLLLEYARGTGDSSLSATVAQQARNFFRADAGCAPNVEVSGSDFFSPCLMEAALMGQVLTSSEYAAWLSAFLPDPSSDGFRALREVVHMEGDNTELEKSNMLGAKAHLIGLAVTRAKAMEDIAAALPAGDRRVAAYRRIATQQAQGGIAAMHEADYVGTHWIGTFIVDYLVSAGRRADRS